MTGLVCIINLQAMKPAATAFAVTDKDFLQTGLIVAICRLYCYFSNVNGSVECFTL
jgi:hypothetical protein